MSDNLAGLGFRRCLHMRRVVVFGAACAGLILAGGQALASTGCTNINNGSLNGVTKYTIVQKLEGGPFTAGDV